MLLSDIRDLIIVMIKFERHILDNGLVILMNQDKTTPLVAFDILYNVGSKNEDESKTGLAHLFEHLMFSGTEQVPDFDNHTQIVGGENNAFTNADITNFYITLPAQNIETAFWLESDRMVNLVLSKEKFENEKRVVIEEFKETSINIPYGDMWHHLSALSYTQHPYKWPTIGKKIEHIEKFSINDIFDFYNEYYHPKNAVVSISGNFEIENIIRLAEKWFGRISKTGKSNSLLPIEPKQLKSKVKILEESVPSNALYMAFHMSSRNDASYYSQDLISDILGRGRSSRLYQNLVKDREIFTDLYAYVTGNMDPGLLIVGGNFTDNIDKDLAIDSINMELSRMKSELVVKHELKKQINKIENQMAFSEIGILNKAINLAQYELLGDANLINKQEELYENVVPEDILRESKIVLDDDNCSTLLYLKK